MADEREQEDQEEEEEQDQDEQEQEQELGIPKGFAVTLSETMGFLQERTTTDFRGCRVVDSPSNVGSQMLAHCEKLATPIREAGQLRKVRREVFGALEGYQNVEEPRIPPSVEAAMLVNLSPKHRAGVDVVVPGFAERRHVAPPHAGPREPDLLVTLIRAGIVP